MYVFQLFDFYSASGSALLWVSLFQSIAIGWIYGERSIHFFFKTSGQDLRVLAITGAEFTVFDACAVFDIFLRLFIPELPKLARQVKRIEFCILIVYCS